MKATGKLWIWVGVMVILTPLGLILPAYFNAGGAWGEWSAEELQKLVGYKPAGFARWSSLWRSPMPDYTVPAAGQETWRSAGLGYILSALAGVALTVAVALLIGKLLNRKGD